MHISKAILVGATFLLACSTTRADFSILSTGKIVQGNSWHVNNVGLFGSGFDLLVVEVTGAQFKTPGIKFDEPESWSGNLFSSDTLYASGGGVNTNGFNFKLIFSGNSPEATDEVSVYFSAYLPGADNAFASLQMDYDFGTGEFLPTFQNFTTAVTRSGLNVAPVPGAVYLAGLGIGLVGFLRKRLA